MLTTALANLLPVTGDGPAVATVQLADAVAAGMLGPFTRQTAVRLDSADPPAAQLRSVKRQLRQVDPAGTAGEAAAPDLLLIVHQVRGAEDAPGQRWTRVADAAQEPWLDMPARQQDRQHPCLQ